MTKDNKQIIYRSSFKISFYAMINPLDMIVNDVHSKLNPTEIYKIIQPHTKQDILDALTESSKLGKKVSICGSQHSMGGQQFGSDTILLDMRKMNKILGFDNVGSTLEVEAGITWPTVIDYLQHNLNKWSIIQKQTGADDLTLGGAVSSNIHGRGLTFKPFIHDIESITIINSSGQELVLDRKQNYELFRLVVGGYGLFGIITRVKIKLMPSTRIERYVDIIHIKDLYSKFKSRISEGFLYGDFQFSTDSTSENFLKEGVFSSYFPTLNSKSDSENFRRLSADDWDGLFLLGHIDKAKAYNIYTNFYLSTNHQVYDSSLFQLGYYPKNYHERIDQKIGSRIKSSEMITEIYIPGNSVEEYMTEAAKYFSQDNVNVFYGTIRIIKKDDESFLAWARQDYVCVIFNLHIEHSQKGITKAVQNFRFLIDLAIKFNGSFYLTYHNFATKDQIIQCYPEFEEFLKMKKKYDPQEVFYTNWYAYCKRLFPNV